MPHMRLAHVPAIVPDAEQQQHLHQQIHDKLLELLVGATRARVPGSSPLERTENRTESDRAELITTARVLQISARPCSKISNARPPGYLNVAPAWRGVNPAVLMLSALIVLGAALVLSGSTLSGMVLSFMRPTRAM